MRKILVIDDDLDTRLALIELLRKRCQAHVFAASSVLEGIEFLIRQEFEVIVCDYHMPEANGLTLLAYMERQKLTPWFILYSGTWNKKFGEVSYPKFRFINKPDIDQLVKNVNIALDGTG